MAASFILPAYSDVPDYVRAPDSRAEVERASISLGVPPHRLKSILVAALPDFPLSWSYDQWFRAQPDQDRSPLLVKSANVHNKEDFERMFGEGACKKALQALLNAGKPGHFLRIMTVQPEKPAS